MTTTDAPTIREKTTRLIGVFGPTLAYYTIGVVHRALVETWTNGCCTPNKEQRARIEKALELFDQVAEHEGEHIARNWFIGANTSVDIDGIRHLMSPTEAIRLGYFDEAAASAQRMVDDTYQ